MSDKEQEIFEKPVKPKRKLTEKQLAALAAGREKARKKKLEKLEKEGQKDHKTQVKEQRKEKKVVKKEQEILEKIKSKEKEEKAERVRLKRLEDWEKKRCEILERCQNEQQFNLVSKALDAVKEEDLDDIHKVNAKLIAEQKRLQEMEKALNKKD